MASKVGIIGAAGFTGAELVRILNEHPDFDLQIITSDSHKGMSLTELNPTFKGSIEMTFSASDDKALFDCDAVFLAVPHTASLKHTPALLKAGVSVFDLSADYRLRDADLYERWYGVQHSSPELLSEAVFGLPELFREDLLAAEQRHRGGNPILVACAGCYPTASSLAAYPALHNDLAEGPFIIDAISGVTGAGKKATERTHYCFADENVEAYGVGKHRHTPEIEQILNLPDSVVFSPHLAPLKRGLLSTVYLPLKEKNTHSLDEIRERYRTFYQNDVFVSILDSDSFPRTASVAGGNHAQIGLALQESTQTLIAICAIDNLCKGASGQAVQCANIVFGLPETTGLKGTALYV